MKKPDDWLKDLPQTTAETLIRNNVSIESFEAIIARRKDRYRFWLKNNQKFIAEQERELIEHGEKTLAILKSLENKTNKQS